MRLLSELSTPTLLRLMGKAVVAGVVWWVTSVIRPPSYEEIAAAARREKESRQRAELEKRECEKRECAARERKRELEKQELLKLLRRIAKSQTQWQAGQNAIVNQLVKEGGWGSSSSKQFTLISVLRQMATLEESLEYRGIATLQDAQFPLLDSWLAHFPRDQEVALAVHDIVSFASLMRGGCQTKVQSMARVVSPSSSLSGGSADVIKAHELILEVLQSLQTDVDALWLLAEESKAIEKSNKYQTPAVFTFPPTHHIAAAARMAIESVLVANLAITPEDLECAMTIMAPEFEHDVELQKLTRAITHASQKLLATPHISRAGRRRRELDSDSLMHRRYVQLGGMKPVVTQSSRLDPSTMSTTVTSSESTLTRYNHSPVCESTKEGGNTYKESQDVEEEVKAKEREEKGGHAKGETQKTTESTVRDNEVQKLGSNSKQLPFLQLGQQKIQTPTFPSDVWPIPSVASCIRTISGWSTVDEDETPFNVNESSNNVIECPNEPW